MLGIVELTPRVQEYIELAFEAFLEEYLGYEPYWEGDPWPLKFENLAEVLARRAELDAEEADR